MEAGGKGHTAKGDEMKNWKIKVVLCGLLMVFAALSVVSVLGDLGVLTASAAEESAYILREHDGYVAVFCPPEDRSPVMVTDIRVQDLPAGDRRELSDGMGAEDYETMIALLEGLSS